MSAPPPLDPYRPRPPAGAASVVVVSARVARAPGARVRLVALSPRSPRALLVETEALPLAEGQERFVLPPATTLPEAMADPERFPFAVLAGAGTGAGAGQAGGRAARGRRGDAVVGYGVLDRRGYLDHLLDQAERTVLLRGYCVAARAQGRGYGAAGARAVRTLAAQVAASADLVVLSVDESNGAGLAAYSRAGFVDSGARYAGRSGEEVVMVATTARTAAGRASALSAPSRTAAARRT